MLKWLKLSKHHHSGHLRPHIHTAYLPLGLFLLIVGFALVSYTVSADEHPGPQAGSIGLSGTMPAEPPTEAAVIKTPVNGQHLATSPVTVSGTCPKDTLVEIFKNDIFAGSTACSSSGTFTIDIDMLIGKNILIARVYDALNQTGPDSNIVTVYYDALPTQSAPLTSLDFGGAQLLLSTDAVFRGVFPEKNMSMPITILGGTAPYAINIQWGDSTNSIISRKDNLVFNETHVYKKPGTYQISIQASDAKNRVAFISVVAIVNGQPNVANTTTSASTTVNKLLVLWPLYIGTIAVVISFFIGEWRERRELDKRGLLLET
jgi:hypothetical protein